MNKKFSVKIPVEIPYPSSEDNFFSNVKKEERRSTAYIKNDDWDIYTVGYKLAGDVLADHASSKCGHDLLVYPILFLYRQHLELAIKCLIIKSDNTKPESTHNLNILWTTCLELIKKSHPDIAKERENELQNTTRLIGELCRYDPKSFAFRYQLQKDYETSALPNNLKEVSLMNIMKVFGNISNELDYWYLAMSDEP